MLVTGAAGLIGRGVLHQLDRSGIAATALVLADPGDLPVDRIVVGSATDPSAVAEALTGADAVIHLAAIPAPDLASAPEVFGMNTRATYTVLDAAGAAGIRRISIASSINALGIRFSPDPAATPPTLPLSAESATIAADAYSVSKWADEFTAAALSRAYGFDVVALRLPLVGGLGEVPELDDRLLGDAAEIAADPSLGASDLWLYLETRDAAAAMIAALSPRQPGAHVLHVAAPEVSVPYPTESLLDRYWPQVPRRRRFPGREAPVDLLAAERLIGFTARHTLAAGSRPIPDPAATTLER
ncbi:Nucleoside-diphosphate-sugar epimerase [Ruania alba]|uniref:Nucleoside-diphosphate-sugar epimerase n=1 Tax=Ruania alba TaxID=648782 RepID=A0A1H5N0C7_9MICO|nr:Nucleoside-diphosphate-sugar epimerase [Ruania alba]